MSTCSGQLVLGWSEVGCLELAASLGTPLGFAGCAGAREPHACQSDKVGFSTPDWDSLQQSLSDRSTFLRLASSTHRLLSRDKRFRGRAKCIDNGTRPHGDAREVPKKDGVRFVCTQVEELLGESLAKGQNLA